MTITIKSKTNKKKDKHTFTHTQTDSHRPKTKPMRAQMETLITYKQKVSKKKIEPKQSNVI